MYQDKRKEIKTLLMGVIASDVSRTMLSGTGHTSRGVTKLPALVWTARKELELELLRQERQYFYDLCVQHDLIPVIHVKAPKTEQA